MYNYCEPFSEDQVETESGHCWANEVLGGSIIPHSPAVAKPYPAQCSLTSVSTERQQALLDALHHSCPLHPASLLGPPRSGRLPSACARIKQPARGNCFLRKSAKMKIFRRRRPARANWPGDKRNSVLSSEEPGRGARGKYSTGATIEWILDLRGELQSLILVTGGLVLRMHC